MKHKIQILKNQAIDSLQDDWIEIHNIFADIKELNPYNYKLFENFGFGYEIPANYFIFTIRFIELAQSNIRIKFNDNLYQVQKITNVNQENRFLQLLGVGICL